MLKRLKVSSPSHNLWSYARVIDGLVYGVCERKEGPRSPRHNPQIWICGSGDWLRFTLKSHRHHHPTDCNQASQISPGGASGDRWLSSLHWCSGKTHGNNKTFIFVKDVGMYFNTAEDIRTSQR